MFEKQEAARIYLIRHATPDWSRTDIPYLIPPGPPLVPAGEKEAELLGGFMREEGIKKLYHSPFERTRRTAEISAKTAGIMMFEDIELSEMKPGETEDGALGRVFPAWERAVRESKVSGPLGLVTHGGLVLVLLRYIGMDEELVKSYRRKFDHTNPLPPAGAWLAKRDSGSDTWELNLVFIPKAG